MNHPEILDGETDSLTNHGRQSPGARLPQQSGLGEAMLCHFPDGSEFPLRSCRDAVGDHMLVSYLFDGKPQTLWVPREFVRRG